MDVCEGYQQGDTCLAQAGYLLYHLDGLSLLGINGSSRHN